MKEMNIPLKQVFFEITGKCNAKCNYCITGNGTQTGNFVDVEKFKKTINSLYEKKIVDSNTNFSLFNWGEPFLHPQFNEIVTFLSNLNIKFSLSSNLSVIPKNINVDSFKSLESLIISMPGFSQNSYSKIHGFKFDKILDNIKTLSKIIPVEKMKVSYHIYQFNISEIKLAQEYFRHSNIKIFSSFAYFNDYNMATNYLKNSLSPSNMNTISKELLLFYVDDLIKEMPKDYFCPQFEYMNIDENCNVIHCCTAPKNSKDYLVGDANSIDINKLNQRPKSEICKECYETKLVYWAHNTSKISTEFIYGIVK
jgi:MoaA/NifB/PqqE/SkfB family radical SAM enzyme